SLYYNYGDGARGELITDDLNNVYVASCTFSNNFPTTSGVFQPTSGGGQEGVVFKLDYNLSNLLWSSYIGGSKDDAAYSIDTDDEYNILVCGGTNSLDFPYTSGSYDTAYNGGSADAFIAKISSAGNQLMASTYFGSPAYDQSYFVRTGKQNHVFIFGQTKASGNTLIHNALYNVPNSGQFLARFGEDLDTLIWSTVFGTGSGVPNISPTAFAADVCNRVYAAGWGRIFCGYYLGGQIQPWNTNGTWNMQVSSNAIQASTDGQDFYVICLTETASAMDYATFFGESHNNNNANSGHDHVDGGTSRFDKMATLYQSVCASCGGCQGFPTTPGALSNSNNSSNCNNGIFRMNVHNDFPVADFIRPPVGCVPDTVTFYNTGYGTSFLWIFDDGTTDTAANPTHIYTQPGVYTVRLIAYLQNGCHSTDTATKQIMILGHQQPFDTVYTCPGIQIRIGQNPQIGCSYNWINGNVSDSTIANPLTTVYHDTVLLCVVSNGACADTIEQHILMTPITMSIYRDTSDCTSPILLSGITYGQGNYFYHWSSNSGFTDTLNSNMLLPNVYVNITGPQYFYLRVYDTNGCFAIDSVFVNFVSIAMPVVYQNPSCPGSCDGWASVSLNNATPPFNINWSTGNRVDTAVYNLCQGNYSIRVMDAKGCSVTQNFSLADPQGPTVTKTVRHTNCAASCNGYISDTVSGPSTYSFLWLDDS
ncbi:MAG: PKD domain-containing protein, partial [Bacteroidales bacterium]|nr:PKD domain-containing protein [Bacteroidales bacterium]